MAGHAEDLFARLQNRAAVLGLIGEAEDAHLDCKEWPAKDEDSHKMLAKAACGLTNADGGVLVIGMKAESRPKDEPDVVTAAAPVNDTSLVKSRVLGLISNLIEPGIVGIQAKEIATKAKSKSGFVVVYVPKSDGSPRRSRKDWKFYQRIGSATLPMEYWQIEDRFGKRPHPRLELYLEQRALGLSEIARQYSRTLALGLTNTGAGIAKFPGVQFARSPLYQVDSYGIDGNNNFGLQKRPSEKDLMIFGGSADDVVYSGQTVMIAKLVQKAQAFDANDIPMSDYRLRPGTQTNARYIFDEFTFKCEVFCDGAQTTATEKIIPKDEIIGDYWA